jgi:hypothetical protein
MLLLLSLIFILVFMRRSFRYFRIFFMMVFVIKYIVILVELDFMRDVLIFIDWLIQDSYILYSNILFIYIYYIYISD